MVPHHPCGRYLPHHESHRSQLSMSHDRRYNTFTAEPNSYAHVVSRHPLTRNCSAIISDLKLNMTVLGLTATSTGLQPCQRTGDMCVEEVLRKARRLNRCLFHQPKRGFRLSALRETIVFAFGRYRSCLIARHSPITRLEYPAFTTTSSCDG